MRGWFASLLAAVALTVLCGGVALAADAAPDKSAAENAPTVKSIGGVLLAYGDEDIWDENGQVIKRPGVAQKMSVADTVAETPDPLEGWNRMWFGFNDKLYFWALKPVAQGYSTVIPERPRLWVHNFFHNLMYPVRFTSLILQAKFGAAAVETSRFIGNTAFGLGGLGDVTGDLKPYKPIPSTEQDLGLTFGYWGAGNGFYLVWPVLGPSTGRDTVGYVGDYFLTPTSYINPWYWSIAADGYDKINGVSLRIGDYETLKDASVDPYEAVRDAYLRMRFKKMND
ncbi:MAG: VacJ family lipoprotein [Humidesulfovibrio sp.]|nr:VacJ family lipoprotein [Humidesulfovibrio sp.]